MVEGFFAAMAATMVRPLATYGRRLFQRRFRRFEIEPQTSDQQARLVIINPGAAERLIVEVSEVRGAEEQVVVPYVMWGPTEVSGSSKHIVRLASATLIAKERNSLGGTQAAFGALALEGATPSKVHLAGVARAADLFRHEIYLNVRVSGQDTGRRRDALVAVGFNTAGRIRCRVGGT